MTNPLINSQGLRTTLHHRRTLHSFICTHYLLFGKLATIMIRGTSSLHLPWNWVKFSGKVKYARDYLLFKLKERFLFLWKPSIISRFKGQFRRRMQRSSDITRATPSLPPFKSNSTLPLASIRPLSPISYRWLAKSMSHSWSELSSLSRTYSINLNISTLTQITSIM